MVFTKPRQHADHCGAGKSQIFLPLQDHSIGHRTCYMAHIVLEGWGFRWRVVVRVVKRCECLYLVLAGLAMWQAV